MGGDIVESKLWGMRGSVPDTPLYTHNFGRLDGVFTYTDGRQGDADERIRRRLRSVVEAVSEHPACRSLPKQLQPYADRVLLFE